MQRSALFYMFIVSVVGCGIFFILHLGNQLPPPDADLAAGLQAQAAAHGATATADAPAASFFSSVGATLQKSANDPLSRLFVQLLAIIVVCRAVGWVFTRCGQPAVIGEMVAGILLGPSLFGLVAPHAFQFVFLPSSLDALKLFSQIGVCLFMFTVGMEFDVSQLRHKAHTALVVSHASIIIPYFLGVSLAYFLYSQFAQPGASFTAFALFIGICMSITAFPVLVRILKERDIFRTMLGSTATACAAVGDVTAWSILAFVVAIVRASSVGAAAFNLCLVVVFVSVMLFVVKRHLPAWIGQAALERPDPGKGVLAAVIGIVLASALCTELIGIHALFGAFMAGIIMPDTGDFRHKLAVRIESVSSVLLLPLFFAFVGLRTQIGLLNNAGDWLVCGVIIAVATIGKLGGSAFSARFTGMPWAESLQLGALMNTRGLMELIALNIGYDLGILSQRIFAMLVLMALVTTMMTGPLFTFFGKMQRVPAPGPEPLGV